MIHRNARRERGATSEFGFVIDGQLAENVSIIEINL
jgi:hypothetical protein